MLSFSEELTGGHLIKGHVVCSAAQGMRNLQSVIPKLAFNLIPRNSA